MQVIQEPALQNFDFKHILWSFNQKRMESQACIHTQLELIRWLEVIAVIDSLVLL